MKKSLIFWFAAATCAAWILVGCDNGTTTTETVTNTVGAAADLDGLQALLAEPGVNQVTYYGDLTITGGKLVSVPEGKTLTVTGGITLASATDVLVVAGGLNFTGTIANSGIVIGVATDKVSGGTTGAIVSGLDDPKIGTVSAMKDYTLTSNASAIPNTLTLYVYGNLTVAADSVAPTGGGKVVAIGTVTLTGDNAAALADATYVDVSKATITYGGSGTVEVTLPATLSSPTFKVTNEQGVLKVGSATTTVNATVTANNGYVEFAGAVTQATIAGGGRVRFKNGSTATGFTGAASSITASVIEFTNGLSTAESAPLTLSGAVYIPDEKAITFGHANGTLTLKEGSAVYAGTPGGTGTAKVLDATEEAVLTPVANATLTAAVSTKKLTLGDADLALTSGTLAVAAGAELVGDDLTVKGTLVADGTVKTSGETNSVAITKATVVGDESTGAVFAAAGTLTLAATDQLVLADEGSVTTAGSGKVTVGTTFELSGAGTWTAGTDTVTFAGAEGNTGTITGGTSATLTPSGTAELKLLAASNVQALTIGGTTQFTLDLSAAGKITFDATTAGSTITLTANSDGIKLTESLAIVGTGDASGSPFTGAFVDGTGEYNASTLNVSLIDGIIKHSTTSAAKPEQIDKNTAAASLASADS